MKHTREELLQPDEIATKNLAKLGEKPFHDENRKICFFETLDVEFIDLLLSGPMSVSFCIHSKMCHTTSILVRSFIFPGTPSNE